jgi:AraC-like DNA-binding protein
MSAVKHKTCIIGPEISAEQFVPEHLFFYLIEGKMNGYCGNKNYNLKPGDYCVGRKNQLARYNNPAPDEPTEKVILIFDEKFLKQFKERHKINVQKFDSVESVIWPVKNNLVPEFIHSLSSYYNSEGIFDQAYADVKREELLLILLQAQPELAGLFFDFSVPGKINLEEFMNRNYTFNVSLERFAYLTGRSLSSFKRDFKTIFNETPNHWLVQKRLQEAHFLIDKKDKKPSEFYLDLGFEDISHFSFAFKKLFGVTPTELGEQRKNISR